MLKHEDLFNENNELRKIVDELRKENYELHCNAFKNNKNKLSIEQLEYENEILRKENIELKKRIDAQDRMIVDLNKKVDNQDRTIIEQNNTIVDLKTEIVELKNENINLNEKIDLQNNTISDLKNDLVDLKILVINSNKKYDDNLLIVKQNELLNNFADIFRYFKNFALCNEQPDLTEDDLGKFVLCMKKRKKCAAISKKNDHIATSINNLGITIDEFLQLVQINRERNRIHIIDRNFYEDVEYIISSVNKFLTNLGTVPDSAFNKEKAILLSNAVLRFANDHRDD